MARFAMIITFNIPNAEIMYITGRYHLKGHKHNWAENCIQGAREGIQTFTDVFVLYTIVRNRKKNERQNKRELVLLFVFLQK